MIRGFTKIRGTLLAFGGPHNKDYSVLGSILGSPSSGKLPKRDSNLARGYVLVGKPCLQPVFLAWVYFFLRNTHTSLELIR